MSYESSVTGAVYQNFTRIASIYQSVSYNPKLPVYTGRDFGRDGLAFIAANYDHTTEWLYVFDSFIRFKWDILDFC
ncbi:MAG: hypothetical protein LBD75_03260 [Candidatus Peribacteria bacterium]|nr:hypothetical protein [Candidatus Peribacteria bacterium]